MQMHITTACHASVTNCTAVSEYWTAAAGSNPTVPATSFKAVDITAAVSTIVTSCKTAGTTDKVNGSASTSASADVGIDKMCA